MSQALLPAPNVDDPRTWAEGQYKALRAQGLEPMTAFGMIATLARTQQQDLPVTQIQVWAEADRWEAAARAERNQQVLLLPGLAPDQMVRQLLARREQAFDAWELASQVVQLPDPSDKAFVNYQIATAALHTIEDELRQIAIDTARRYAEQSALPRWRARLEEVRTALLERYHVRGPQYAILAHRLAAAEVRMEMLEEQPAASDPKEYTDLTNTIRFLTNQLQKYTESIKTEVIREEVNDAVVKVLTMIEHHVAAEYPQLWKRIVDDIERRMGEAITEHNEDGEILV